METCNMLLTDPFSQCKCTSIPKTSKNVPISLMGKDKIDLCCQETNCKLNITLLKACMSQIH